MLGGWGDEESVRGIEKELASSVGGKTGKCSVMEERRIAIKLLSAIKNLNTMKTEK